ncbi:MAG: uracil-DNA glycosylase [Thermoanaerobaculia bacterium]|nr:uracil-DNA glycosylase [Thermoanaerobaculia bacterium]
MPTRTRRPRRADALTAALGYFRDLGVRDVLLPPPSGAPLPEGAGAAAAVIGGSSGPETRSASPVNPAPAAFGDLESIRAAVASCQLCGLCRTRTQTVFSDGGGRSRLMFVGEAPGADEDASGVPFVGRAGQLLTKMIEAGMGLSRRDVYIANVLKCRPPGNRNPEPDEIASCRPYLDAQIDLVKPAVLVALGKFAAQFLLDTEEPISRLRGRWGSRNGIPVMPTYHPSFLLRQPEKKKEAWADLQQVLQKLGLPVPGRKEPQSP